MIDHLSRISGQPAGLGVDAGRLADFRFACLTYHRIGSEEDQYSVTEEQLRSHLTLLLAESRTAEGFEQLEERLLHATIWPIPYALLTFDDGDESSLRAADVLERYGANATFFLTRDRCLNASGFIREPQIRELRKRGFSLGTHGTTHRKLTQMPERACIQELENSKCWLEDVIGEEVRYMAAPGGYINSNILKLAYQRGYTLVGTCHERMNSLASMTLPNTVNRVNVRRHFSLKAFRQATCGSYLFYIWRMARALGLAVPKRFA
jgi:peptidoglycan/xylan/chitin deacetylase (PgdA/CDA1 family)